MYSHTPLPELELALYRQLELEMVRRLEMRRLGDLNRIEWPTVRDRLLLTAGGTLVTCGEWLKERSRPVASTAQYAR